MDKLTEQEIRELKRRVKLKKQEKQLLTEKIDADIDDKRNTLKLNGTSTAEGDND